MGRFHTGVVVNGKVCFGLKKGVETQVKGRPHDIYFQPWTNRL